MLLIVDAENTGIDGGKGRTRNEEDGLKTSNVFCRLRRMFLTVG